MEKETMNIRDISGINLRYSQINREERNYAAVFFTALCAPGNGERFLTHCGIESRCGEDFGIYFEYSHLRDLWYRISDENIKKQIIRKKLPIPNIDDILDQPVRDINAFFGVAGNPSSRFIQYPGKWAISKYSHNFPDNDDFITVCRFKWAFNIKPDIVIHLDKERAICIEAKYESAEGSYPSSEKDSSIFRKRGLDSIGQTALQTYMMEDLLGIQTEFMFLVYKKQQSTTHKTITWAEAFGCMDLTGMPPFAVEMIENMGR